MGDSADEQDDDIEMIEESLKHKWNSVKAEHCDCCFGKPQSTVCPVCGLCAVESDTDSSDLCLVSAGIPEQSLASPSACSSIQALDDVDASFRYTSTRSSPAKNGPRAQRCSLEKCNLCAFVYSTELQLIEHFRDVHVKQEQQALQDVECPKGHSQANEGADAEVIIIESDSDSNCCPESDSSPQDSELYPVSGEIDAESIPDMVRQQRRFKGQSSRSEQHATNPVSTLTSACSKHTSHGFDPKLCNKPAAEDLQSGQSHLSDKESDGWLPDPELHTRSYCTLDPQSEAFSRDVIECQQPDNFRGMWPTLSRRAKTWAATSAAEQLWKPHRSKICSSVPQQCQQNCSFIVDVTKLHHPLDILGDDNGAFHKPTITKTGIVIDFGHARFTKKGEEADYTLKRRYYTHKGTPTFRRIVYETWSHDKQHPFVLLQYMFSDGIAEEVKYTTYGNQEKEDVFMPRRKSLKIRVKQLSKTLPPAKVVSMLQQEAGGSESLQSISATPRNSQQVKNLKRKLPDAHRSRNGSAKATNFDSVLKMSLKGDFVRAFEVSKGGHPRSFCATEQQLQDLERCCTGSAGVLLQIDPTFSVGEFSLTCTAFRHPQFQNKRNGKHVLVAGPYLIHSRKEEADYEDFARHLSVSVKGKSFRACGSDGEKALVNGFKRVPSFRDSIWLTCMLHAQDNAKRKMGEIGIAPKTCNRILRHIYGAEVETSKGRKRVLGLVDAQTKGEFEEKLAEKCGRWDEYERSDTGKPPQFSKWFQTYKAKECRESMLAPLRQDAGLGNPPCQFTTNDVECENLRVKLEVDWKKKTWDQAANHLHVKVLAQYEQLSRAIYKEGEYRLANSHKHLEMEPYEWVVLSVAERRQHLHWANLKQLPTKTAFSITAEESGITGFSIGDLKELWTEAEQLAGNEASVGHHPANVNQHVVYDTETIHTVQQDSGQFYRCDAQCVQFQEHDGLLCRHTLAVAERKGNLPDFIGLVNTNISRRSATVLNAALNDACSGAGGKSSKKRKGRNNRVSSGIAITEGQLVETFPPNYHVESVPSTSSLLPVCSGAVCAPDRTLLPPLTPLQLSLQERQPFTVTFRQGLIKRCHGCSNLFAEKTRKCPYDIVLKKSDFKEYKTNDVWHRSNSLANTYYHLNANCMRRNFPHTQLSEIVLYEDIKEKLFPGHVELLHRFGCHKACHHS